MPSPTAAPPGGADIATISAPFGRPGVMMSDDETTENASQAARRKLAADEWLLPSEIGAAFGVSRFVVNRWLARGQVVITGHAYPLRHRPRLLGSYREVNPEDVTAALAAYDQARQNEEGTGH